MAGEVRGPLLGCIADDLTGATDLANMLVRGGMRTVQVIGVPAKGAPLPEADAVVVALKSRTIPAAEAVAQSLAAFAGSQAGRHAADLLQVLLDLRFHRCRQYRPGRRCAADGAGRRVHHRLPGFPGERPHDLSGPSVRRRPAALGLRHAEPSADADDRRESRARARPADEARRSVWCRCRVVREGAAAIAKCLRAN